MNKAINLLSVKDLQGAVYDIEFDTKILTFSMRVTYRRDYEKL